MAMRRNDIWIIGVLALAAVLVIARRCSSKEQPEGQAESTEQTAPPSVEAGPLPDAKALLRQGVVADKAGDYAVAVGFYRQAAMQGLPEAQNNLGVMYKDGQGVAQDYAEAARWFAKAALQGNILAQSNLGWLYQSGHGVAQDFSAARHWYLKAACRGHAAAQNNLGTMYRDGQGVTQNLDSARYWLEQAAAQGMALAQRNLANLNK